MIAELLLHWKAILVAFITLILAGTITFLYVDLEKETVTAALAQKNYGIVMVQNQALNSDNANLVLQLKNQNQSITDQAAAEFAAKAAAASALLAAQAQQATTEAEIKKLNARAATNQGDCDDELEAIRVGR